MSFFRRTLRRLALGQHGYEGLYRRLCNPSALEWAAFLRERGDFYSMGEYCAIHPYAYIDFPPLIRLGNNVRLAKCSIFCHDGSVNMINRAFGLRLDNVGKVDILDNVFIGYGAVILQGVTIGPNAIVAVGSVVRSDVAEGDIVAGIPARPAGRLDMSIAMLKAKNQTFPWRHLIEKRAVDFDPEIEVELAKARAMHYYGALPRSLSESTPRNSWLEQLLGKGNE